MTTEDLLNYFYQKDTILLDGRKAAKVFKPDQLVGVKATPRHPPSRQQRAHRQGRAQVHQGVHPPDGARPASKQIPITLEEVHRARVGARRRRIPRPARCCSSATRSSPARSSSVLRERGIDDDRGPVHRRHSTSVRRCATRCCRTRSRSPEEAILEIYRRLRPGDPPTTETATTFFNNLFFNPERYDLSRVGRLKLNHKLSINVPLEQGHAAPRGHPRGRALPDRAQERQRADRRHRPPRQPPRARRRRAGRESVPHRPGPHGARHQGAHEPAGHRDADAAGAHQLQAGVGGHQGVLRVEPALAVHGPDQPALRDHRTSAASRRSDPAVSRASAPASRCATCTRRTTAASVRSRRRKVRTSVSSPRSRPTRASTTSASSRRPYREVENGRVTERDPLPLGARGREDHVIAQANAPIDAQGRLHGRPASPRASGGEFMHGAARAGASSWTSRRTSSSASRPR